MPNGVECIKLSRKRGRDEDDQDEISDINEEKRLCRSNYTIDLCKQIHDAMESPTDSIGSGFHVEYPMESVDQQTVQEQEQRVSDMMRQLMEEIGMSSTAPEPADILPTSSSSSPASDISFPETISFNCDSASSSTNCTSKPAETMNSGSTACTEVDSAKTSVEGSVHLLVSGDDDDDEFECVASGFGGHAGHSARGQSSERISSKYIMDTRVLSDDNLWQFDDVANLSCNIDGIGDFSLDTEIDDWMLFAASSGFGF